MKCKKKCCKHGCGYQDGSDICTQCKHKANYCKEHKPDKYMNCMECGGYLGPKLHDFDYT